MNNILIANNIAVAVRWFIDGNFRSGIRELRDPFHAPAPASAPAPAPGNPYDKVHYTT